VRVKRLSHGLVPLELEGDGLGVALHRLAHASDVPGRLHCVFKQRGALEVRNGFVATHLYRIAQEAVTNALRHSRANRITISLTHDAGRAVLTVADNGNGGKPRDGEGRGLRIMAYRASLIGAILNISRVRSKGPAKGTQVSCAFTACGGTSR
jgi:signal transduction histidine kinase